MSNPSRPPKVTPAMVELMSFAMDDPLLSPETRDMARRAVKNWKANQRWKRARAAGDGGVRD